MALKKKLTKEEFDKLSDSIKEQYIEDGEGFRLDLEGDEDTGALKRAKDRESQLRKDAEAKLREAQKELEALGTDDARKKGDIETLEKSWNAKLAAQQEESKATIERLTNHTRRTLVDNIASQIAHKISTAPKVILPHIKQRLLADFDGDEPTTKVLGKDGKPSDLTIDDLAAEFVANKDFSAIITASNASGGARKALDKPGGGATDNQRKTNLSEMNAKDLANHLKESKETAK